MIIVISNFKNTKSNKHKKAQEKVDCENPILSYAENDCYMTSVLNVLLKMNSFCEFLDNNQHKPVGRIISILNELRSDFLNNGGETLQMGSRRNFLLNGIATSLITPMRMNDAGEFLLKLVESFIRDDFKSEYFRFILVQQKITDEEMLKFNATDGNIVTSTIFSDSLEPHSIQGESKVKSDFANMVLNRPKILFVLRNLSQLCIPPNLCSQILNFENIRYRLMGLVCFQTCHYYAILMLNDGTLVKHDNTASLFKQGLNQISNCSIMFYERI